MDYKDIINKELIPYLNNNNDYIKMNKHDLFNILSGLLEMFLIYLKYRFDNDLRINFILSKKVKMKDILRTWIKLYYLGMIIDTDRKDLSLFCTIVLGVSHIDLNAGGTVYNGEHLYLNCFVLRTGDKVKFSIRFNVILDEYYNKAEVVYDQQNMVLQKKRNKNTYDIVVSDIIKFKDNTYYSDIVEHIDKILDVYSDKNKLCIMFNRASL